MHEFVCIDNLYARFLNVQFKERDFLASKNEYAAYINEIISGNNLVVLDVGANGMLSIECASKLSCDSRIYAFEPFSQPHACLSNNAHVFNASKLGAIIVPLQLAVMETHVDRICPTIVYCRVFLFPQMTRHLWSHSPVGHSTKSLLL